MAKRVGNLLRRMDSYGYKVQLHYKNEPEYKSVLGGSLTLVTFLVILVYFLVLL